jgi:hypothetical protein
MNFYLLISYLLMDLCEPGTENLHIMPLCKYQINWNRSSGNHTVVQGVNENMKYFSEFCSLSKYSPVQNMFATICWVTVSFIKIRSLKDIPLWRRGAQHRVVLAYFSVSALVSSTWRCTKGMTETCCGWSNQMNVLCPDVVFVWI